VVTGTAGGPELCHYAGEPFRPIAGAKAATAFGNAMNYELSDASCHEFFTTARLSRKPDLRRDQTCALRRELYMIDPLPSFKKRFAWENELPALPNPAASHGDSG
jgi:hypothetical protein